MLFISKMYEGEASLYIKLNSFSNISEGRYNRLGDVDG